MEDYLEIDIKQLIKKLVSKWFWIFAAALLIGVSTFLFFFLAKDIYESKAIIALVQPRFQAEFDSNFTTSNLAMPSEGFLTDSVLSNVIVQELFSAWSNPEKNEIPLENFAKNNLSVTLNSKGAVIILAVKAVTAQEAADLANLWAELAVRQINTTYFGIDAAQVVYFEEQIESTKLAYDASGEALVEFMAKDNSDYLQIQLDNTKAKVSDTLQRRMVLEAAESDVLGMVDYLGNYEPEAIVRPSDLLNFTLIQSRVYGSPVVSGLANSPIQLQFVVESTGEDRNNREFIEVLDGWTATLRTEMANLDEENVALVSKITELQSSIKEIQQERSLLETDYDLNKTTYITLKTKLEEVRLNIDSADSNAKTISMAIPPEEAIPHNTVRNTLIALIASTVLSSIAVLLIDWWKSDKKIEEEAQA